MAFFEFNIAVSGLFAAQRGLGVTSNNISNAATDTYSRQVLNQKADTPLSGIGKGMTGTGVTTTGITRVRDSYIDLKLWSQNAKLGEYNAKVTQNALIEGAFGEPTDAGFTKVFNNLFTSMDNLSKDPTSGEAKVALRENIISFTNYYTNIAETLKSYQQDANYEIKATVDEINILGSRIQSLNKQIFEAEIYGDDANSFRDERDACIDRLSQIINTEAKEEEKVVNGKTVKTFSVKIGGQMLVDHLDLNALGVEVRGTTEANINRYTSELSKLNGEYATLMENKARNGALTAGEEAKVTQLEKEMDDLVQKLKTEGAKVESGDQTRTAGDGTVYTTTQYQVSYQGEKTLDANNAVTALTYEKPNECDADNLYDVIWKSGLSFDMTSVNLSGELKGLIDMRDGCGTGADVTYNGIPYYITRLNDYVKDFSRAMNDAYNTNKDGYVDVVDAPFTDDATKTVTHIKRTDKETEYYSYDATSGEYTKLGSMAHKADGTKDDTYVVNKLLFSYTTGDASGTPIDSSEFSYDKMSASNFSISKEIYTDIKNLTLTYDPSDKSDGTFWSSLSNQKNNASMFAEGTPSDYMVSIFSELGISSQEAHMYQGTQTSVTNVIKNQRLAVSQVDMTEEFTNLIKYQQAYQAAAKIMNTIDGIYETTIFKLGNF